jgi:hypothetical protein
MPKVETNDMKKQKIRPCRINSTRTYIINKESETEKIYFQELLSLINMNTLGLEAWLKLVECLPSKCEALSSNPVSQKKKERKMSNLSENY